MSAAQMFSIPRAVNRHATLGAELSLTATSKICPSESSQPSVARSTSSTGSTALGSLAKAGLRSLHAPSKQRSTRGAVPIKLSVRPPYELEVSYDLSAAVKEFQTQGKWNAFLVAFDAARLSEVGRGASLDDLCTARGLSWIQRSCRCSDFVPLNVKTGPSTAKIKFNPLTKTENALVLLRILISTEQKSLESSGNQDWVVWGDAMVVSASRAEEPNPFEISATEEKDAGAAQPTDSTSASSPKSQVSAASQAATQAAANDDAMHESLAVWKSEHAELKADHAELQSEHRQLKAKMDIEVIFREKYSEAEMEITRLRRQLADAAAEQRHESNASAQLKADVRMMQVEHTAVLEDFKGCLQQLGVSRNKERHLSQRLTELETAATVTTKLADSDDLVKAAAIAESDRGN